ncbi:MAG: prepilin-type N-terminal cleavage/methylation domain-containing protein [Planctomycetota bacterium]|jgi:prepilin-type N-terminal cleavage/methylation domain-containing protein
MANNRRGFTLIEMLVVIAIILILASLLVVLISSVINHSRWTRTKGFVELLSSSCTTYYHEFKEYPPDNPYNGSQNLHFYLGREFSQASQKDQSGNAVGIRQRKPYIEFKRDQLEGYPTVVVPSPPVHLVDAWMGRILYIKPGIDGRSGPEFVDIWSPGLDGNDGTEDDIVNWKRQT